MRAEGSGDVSDSIVDGLGELDDEGAVPTESDVAWRATLGVRVDVVDECRVDCRATRRFDLRDRVRDAIAQGSATSVKRLERCALRSGDVRDW